ncbi:MAG: hypothetical protein RI909_861 [Bacteroidota bacterium]|jgi:hypothetical protein
MNVLVFKTSVESRDHINYLAPLLDSLAGRGAWNFDLTDCDRILRIVSDQVNPETAMRLINSLGFVCHELED